MAGGLDSAGLMGVHMGGVGGNDRLIGLQKGFDREKVRLGAAHQEVNIRIRRGAYAADGLPGSLTAGIRTVTDGLFQIGVHQGLEDLGMGAFTVIVSEAVHIFSPALKK